MKKILLSISLSLILNFGTGALQAFSKSINSASPGFLENKGQIVDQNYDPNPGVKFLLCSPGFNVQLRQTGFSYDTYTDSVNGKPTVTSPPSQIKKSADQQIIQRRYHRVDVELLNCNKDAQLFPYDASGTYFNYFTGGAPEGGVTNVHSYQKIIYKNIYPNIDLEFKINNKQSGGAEYDFIVHPGGRISDIQLSYSGANKMFLENNMLKVQVTAGTFTENIPSSYLIDNPQSSMINDQLQGTRDKGQQTVDVQYVSTGNNVYSFRLQSANVNPQSTIIIDPTPNLAWGTYYGGSGSTISGLGDQGNGIAVDGNGNVCITGYTISANNIATVGAYQTNYGGAFTSIFVSQFSAAGALNWGTYYNGAHGGISYGWAIAVDNDNNIYIAGETGMSGMATNGAYKTTLGSGGTSGIIAKFSSSGNQLIWGTYYAGNVITSANEIAVDAVNNVYIMGWTEATNLPTTTGAYQPLCDPPPTRGITGEGNQSNYIAKFNSTGTSLLWGTYFGGQTYGQDSPGGIAVDKNGNVYIAGQTGDISGKTTNNAYRTVFPAGTSPATFIAKFNPALSGAAQLVWGTYYGGYGAYGSTPGGIALDPDDNLYITGTLSGIDTIAPFPTTIGTYQPVATSGNNVYIAKFNPILLDTNQLVWGTYYGAGLTIPKGIVVDACGKVTIAGWTNSDTLIATPGAWQDSIGKSNGTVGANEDAFVAKFDSLGKTLLWGTYFGGGGQDNANAIALSGDNVYITGLTSSVDSIATAGAHQTTYPNAFTNTGSNYEWSGFVADFNNAGCASCLLNSISITSPADSICPGESATLTATTTPSGTSYLWSNGSTTRVITVDTTGDYSCIVYICQDSVHASPIHITLVSAPPSPAPTISHDTLFCNSNPVYTSYQWSFDSTIIASATDTFLVINKSGEYNIQVTNANGCKTATGINVIIDKVQNYLSDNNVSLSPNPATNQLTIHIPILTGTVTVSIFNVLGQETSFPINLTLSPSPKGEGSASIDVSGLPAGMYFLQLQSARGSLARKFVKE